ncbi:hypothetical protein NUH88_07490 [Nisaea acidiphila]|uniref:DUF296 domain-containing protein n=1 Tax=Nisaea acidiphila TaxID=1862145 RepID=A0A9J7AUV5_9PROT|nr:hypothetical protein [Nisaea acidiphila]UUX51531.1 hypothetical protein NUH88_07490 [Nisaea acidiphila]
MRTVTHPGPVAEERQEILPAEGRPVALTLKAGLPFEDAVGEAMAAEGLDGAWLEIEEAIVSCLDYVIPALSPDADHVAWYSNIHSFGGPGRIERLGMMVGRENGASFLHGHGLWAPTGGEIAMGHILAPRTMLAAPTVARGIGLTGARFERRPDPETNFTLFRPSGNARNAEDSEYALVRLAPNQDFTGALDTACAGLGWDGARVHGLGSLIGATFEGGSVLGSLPTEFLILDAEARAEGQSGPGPEIAIVGTEGGDIREGALKRGENAVLITAELLLERR